jgi:hypothetical protein
MSQNWQFDRGVQFSPLSLGCLFDGVAETWIFKRHSATDRTCLPAVWSIDTSSPACSLV